MRQPGVQAYGPGRAFLVRCGVLVFGGALTGAAGGWWGLLTRDGPVEVAEVASRPYLALVVVLPLLFTLAVRGEATSGLAHNLLRPAPLLQLGGSGLVGACAATLFYTLAAVQVPAIFGREDAANLADELWPAIAWWRITLVVAVNTAWALLVGAVVGNQVEGARSDG